MDGSTITFLVLILMYFLPTIVAFMRQQYNTTSIFILNLFLGWSVIGWVVALVWAFKKPDTQATTILSSSNADEIKKLKELADAGIISAEEYETKKQLLLR